jgi:DNA-binding NtrC family response regulator
MKKVNTLIVEDDSLFTSMLENMLGELVGKIHKAKSSIDAREILNKVKPNSIFLDNWLPGVNGIQLIQEFKQLSPDCYIIVMSSFSDVTEIAECIQNGADDILSKDNFGTKELNTVLDKLKKSKKSFDWTWLIPDVFKSLPSINNHIARLEDDEIFSFHLKWILGNAKENIVNSFTTSKEFLSFYSSQSPDILFLDFHLPDGKGDELLSQVKLKMPNTKVIMISSQEEIDVAIDLKRKGAISYISKNKNWREQLSVVMTELVI